MWSELEVGNERDGALKDPSGERTQSVVTNRFSLMVQLRSRKRSVEHGRKK